MLIVYSQIQLLISFFPENLPGLATVRLYVVAVTETNGES